MTEFAFSGVGINPHYGTPGNPYDRTLVPGGSSAGAPVSVPIDTTACPSAAETAAPDDDPPGIRRRSWGLPGVP